MAPPFRELGTKGLQLPCIIPFMLPFHYKPCWMVMSIHLFNCEHPYRTSRVCLICARTRHQGHSVFSVWAELKLSFVSSLPWSSISITISPTSSDWKREENLFKDYKACYWISFCRDLPELQWELVSTRLIHFCLNQYFSNCKLLPILWLSNPFNGWQPAVASF